MKAAVLGTNDYHAVMQQAAKNAFRRQAGYALKRGVFVDDPVAKRGELLKAGKSNGGWNHIDVFSQYCAGYGWVAGSAALWRFLQGSEGAVSNWEFNDVDIFCHTESAYEVLAGKTTNDVKEESERGIKFNGFRFFVNGRHFWLTGDVNFIKPLPGDNWHHPANVLAGFDLSICAVVMTQPGVVYALYPHDLRNHIMDYTGQTIAPIATMRRVFKYLRRGFKLGAGFWHRMAADERMLPVMGIFEELNGIGDEKRIASTVIDIDLAVPSGVVYNSYDRDDDYDDYEDYD